MSPQGTPGDCFRTHRVFHVLFLRAEVNFVLRLAHHQCSWATPCFSWHTGLEQQGSRVQQLHLRVARATAGISLPTILCPAEWCHRRIASGWLIKPTSCAADSPHPASIAVILSSKPNQLPMHAQSDHATSWAFRWAELTELMCVLYDAAVRVSLSSCTPLCKTVAVRSSVDTCTVVMLNQALMATSSAAGLPSLAEQS